jgi:hypothetical protein
LHTFRQPERQTYRQPRQCTYQMKHKCLKPPSSAAYTFVSTPPTISTPPIPREMRLTLAAARSRANTPALARGEQVPTVALHQRDMLRLATIDGARVWNLQDEIGSLTPGKHADVTVIDMQSPHLDGYGDSIATMVLGAGPADVETVIVGGDVTKRGGQLVGDHVSKARGLMLASRERLRASERSVISGELKAPVEIGRVLERPVAHSIKGPHA